MPPPPLDPAQGIPQTDPRANYLARAAEIDAAIARVLGSGRYLLGAETTAFEAEFAEFVGIEHCITCASGTEALHLALRACDIGPGDEVITVSHTAVATAAAIDLCGARPVLVDIERETCNLDPRGLEVACGPRTRAVIPVHLYGQPADLRAIREFCRRHQLRLIEDCSQAHGAAVFSDGDTGEGRRTVRVGSVGDLAAFSFYPTKNLGALGDGGAVVTRDAGLAERLRSLRQYGWRRTRYISDEPGWNARMDELQAAVLRVKLRGLPADNDRRRSLAALYRAQLLGLPNLVLPSESPHGSGVWHQFAVRTPRRDALAEHLRAAGIGTLVHYPVPVHRQPAYASRALAAGPLPETDAAAAEVLSLPMFPELVQSAALRVTEALRRFAELRHRD